MDIRCPSCHTLYEFNEARLKRGPVNLKCSQCGHVFRVEGRKGKGASTARSKRWMLRKVPAGDVLYFQGLPKLQKWIVDRKVTRQDEISKTGRTWRALGEISELSSFFQVADNLDALHAPEPVAPAPQPSAPIQPPVSVSVSSVPFSGKAAAASAAATSAAAASASAIMPNPAMSGLMDSPMAAATPEPVSGPSSMPAAVPMPSALHAQPHVGAEPEPVYDAEPEYFDPLAPGPPANEKDAWALGNSQQGNNDWTFNSSTSEALPGPSLGMNGAEESLGSPQPLQFSGPSAGTFDDPLDAPVDERRRDGVLPWIALLLLLLIVGLLAFVYFYHPDWLGMNAQRSVASADAGMSPSAAGASGADAQQASLQGDAQQQEGNQDASAVANADAVEGDEALTKGQDKEGDKGDKGDDDAQKGGDKNKDNEPKKAADADKGKARPVKEASNNTRKRPANDGVEKSAPIPRGFDGVMDRARGHLKAGRANDALRDYSRAVEMRPNSIAAICGKGRAYMALGLPQGALRAYEKALGISPGNGLALIGVADAYRRSGNTAKAIEYYKKYLDRYPKGPTAERAKRQLQSMGAAVPP